MIQSIFLLSIFLMVTPMTLFDFDSQSDLANWMIVDDVVMGGRSNGQFEINENGHGLFHGYVSTENYGGFSSVRYTMDRKEIKEYSTIQLRLKGDGKSYQFRTKTDSYDRHSYIYNIKTSGEWQVIEIPLSEMIPQFRGRRLNLPNYPSEFLEEVAILIGNKKNESFKLEIDYIDLKF